MPDWRAFVHERLARLGLGDERDEEIRAELAEHLEDAYQDALARGHAPDAAMAIAREQVPDWTRLASRIRTAGEENEVTNTAKTIWVPGTTVLLFSLTVLMVLTGMVPPRLWLEGNGPMLILSVWMLSYLGFGALGASWSGRNGGNASARFLSGVFPLTMHVAVLILLLLVSLISAEARARFPEHRDLAWLLRSAALWIGIPAIALSLGTLPFLRKQVRARP